MVVVFSIYKRLYLVLGIEDKIELSFVKDPRKLSKTRRKIYLLSLMEKMKRVREKIFQLRVSKDYNYIKAKVELLAEIHPTVVPGSQYPYFFKYSNIIPRKFGLNKYKKEIYLADSLVRLFHLRAGPHPPYVIESRGSSTDRQDFFKPFV